MIEDGLRLEALSTDSQLAFVQFLDQTRDLYQRASSNDREHNVDPNGHYIGSYNPEREFFISILAFLDEYGLETEIADISELDDDEEFFKNFKKFLFKVNYTAMRYRLRQNRIESGSIGTVISIADSYKTEIGSHLEKIRKIVNQELQAGNKRDKIYKKIAALQSEVDRDQTTVDAAFGRVLDLSKTLGEAGGNIKPAVDQLERIKKLFWDNSEKVEQLPKPERPKLITEDRLGSDQDYEDRSADTDDEIPF